MPQIDALRDHDETPEYADRLIGDCQLHYTLKQIAAHIGVTTRGLSKMRNKGIKTFGTQLALEVLSGRRKFVEQ